METQKMSLANIQGKLSRTEMKKIMAGSGGSVNCASAGFPCGPYGATCLDPATDWNGTGGSEQDCCCSDDNYNNECNGG